MFTTTEAKDGAIAVLEANSDMLARVKQKHLDVIDCRKPWRMIGTFIRWSTAKFFFEGRVLLPKDRQPRDDKMRQMKYVVLNRIKDKDEPDKL